MHLDNGLAAPCMASVHGIGAWHRCTVLVGWEGRGAWPICVGFGLTCDVINGGLLHEMDLNKS